MEPGQSCCSRERCCGIPMVKGCFAFAIINAVIVGSSVLGSLVYAGLILSVYLDPDERRAQGSNSLFWLISILCIVCCVASLIAATFAVLLCLGLMKGNPRYVMAYLVYGIAVELLSVGGVLGFLYVEWGEWWIASLAAIFLGACLIYALLLLLVYRTYVVLSDGPAPTTHKKLLNPHDC